MKTAKLVRRYLRRTGQVRDRAGFRAIVKETDTCDHRERGRRRRRLREMTPP